MPGRGPSLPREPVPVVKELFGRVLDGNDCRSAPCPFLDRDGGGNRDMARVAASDPGLCPFSTTRSAAGAIFCARHLPKPRRRRGKGDLFQAPARLFPERRCGSTSRAGRPGVRALRLSPRTGSIRVVTPDGERRIRLSPAGRGTRFRSRRRRDVLGIRRKQEEETGRRGPIAGTPFAGRFCPCTAKWAVRAPGANVRQIRARMASRQVAKAADSWGGAPSVQDLLADCAHTALPLDDPRSLFTVASGGATPFRTDSFRSRGETAGSRNSSATGRGTPGTRPASSKRAGRSSRSGNAKSGSRLGPDAGVSGRLKATAQRGDGQCDDFRVRRPERRPGSFGADGTAFPAPPVRRVFGATGRNFDRPPKFPLESRRQTPYVPKGRLLRRTRRPVVRRAVEGRSIDDSEATGCRATLEIDEGLAP